MAESGVGYQCSSDCKFESKDNWKERQEKEYQELFDEFNPICLMGCFSCFLKDCPFILFQRIKDGAYKRRKP